MPVLLAFLGLLLSAPALTAQSEDRLRAYFEGRTVTVKIDMPGTQEGVDVYPAAAKPVDFPKHAGRLKRFGTALRRGEPALITKIKVKDDLIEFQLGGGGYGTFGDDTSPYVSVPSAPKTEREKNLEKDLATVTDPGQKRKIREELDGLRADRRREDARNQAEAAQAQQVKEANIRQRRAEGGSRFNIRYRSAVPLAALTPEGVMNALADYVDFSELAATASDRAEAPDDADLRKGMTVEEVDRLLGRPEETTRRSEGTLTVSTSSYRSRGRMITAEFVLGVMIRFTITSPPDEE